MKNEGSSHFCFDWIIAVYEEWTLVKTHIPSGFSIKTVHY